MIGGGEEESFVSPSPPSSYCFKYLEKLVYSVVELVPSVFEILRQREDRLLRREGSERKNAAIPTGGEYGPNSIS